MIQKLDSGDELDRNILSEAEIDLLHELQRLAAAGCAEVPEELEARIKQTITWSYSDPASIKRAVYFMAHDPFLQREVKDIEADFAAWDKQSAEGR